MPRDLGKAKRSDLAGHFPGEQAEYGSAFARFLEGAGQMRPLEEGTYLDHASGNGNGRSTEVPGRNGESHGSTDTEIGRAPADNGSSETLFDAPDGFFNDDEMFPGEALTPETAELEPVDFEPSADTLHPSGDPEPLESVPDLTSPELDALEEDDEQDTTEILVRDAPMPPPASSADTGLLEPEDVGRLPEEDRISLDELAAEDEETRSRDDDDEERITSKVEPRRDVDPRSLDPNAVVRDTVNFYNQTQNFKEQKGKGGFPTISPNVVNSTQPLEINRERHDTMPLQRTQQAEPELVENEPDLLPSAFADDAMQLPGADDLLAPEPVGGDSTFPDNQTDTLRPGPATSAAEPVLAPMSLDAEPMGLEAEGELDEIDRRETDKFREEDRQPPKLPLPEGTDKVDKEQLARERDGELQPIADEKVAAGKDTQRFYVADILAKKPQKAEPAPTGDTTSELQPAEQGLPDFAAPSSETVADATGDPTVDDRPTRIRTAAERVDLPPPAEVNTDFKPRVLPTASDRIVPELESEPDGDDTVDEESQAPAVEKITDKLAPPPEREKTTRRRAVVRSSLPAETRSSARITDALSQRMKQEREETLRLIEEAEAVAARLRSASEQSRADLIAISERRSSPRQEEPLAPPVTSESDEFATEIIPEAKVSARAETVVSVPASRRIPNRVPTRAIGELVEDLKRAAVGKPSTLSELLAEVSRRVEPVEEEAPDDEDDLDILVAASARLRETLETDLEADRISGRMPAVEPDDEADDDDDDDTSPPFRMPEPPASTLAGDLDRLWKVLDSRRTATVVLPAADKARITRDDQPESMEGWTQEMLWPTMAGIAVVTFLLGALFVWVLSRM